MSDMQYIRVGTSYFKKVKAPTISGDFNEILVLWNIDTIKKDYGKTFIADIPKYGSFTCIPSHTNFQQICSSFYNKYSPLSNKPKDGSVEVSKLFMKHIFGDQDEFTLKDPRIKLLKGLPLPEGWLGKNHACHRLSGKAAGEYLLFMDADVRLKKSLLTNSLAHAIRHRLDMMSIFPVQKMYTFGEKIAVPVMNWVLAGLLPLILTRISDWPSFSAANGQFMLFRAVTYHEYKFHKQLKHYMTEDIAIFRKMKKSGLRTHTVLSNGDISCRMYTSWSESIEGFAKNVIDFFGGYAFMAILFAVLTVLGFIPVILALPWNFVIAFFAVSILTRTVISLISRQSPVNNFIFAPLQQISLFIMIITALIHKKQHSLKWKGRKVYNEEPVSI